MAETEFEDLPDFASASVEGASREIVANVWAEISRLFWTWYAEHANDNIKAKVLIINVNIKVSKLKKMFERIFGPAPA